MFKISKTFINIFFLPIFLLSFFLAISYQNSFAAQTSQRIWGGLSKKDVQNLKEFSKALDKNNHKQALAVAKKMGNSNFSDTAIRIALWNKYSQVDNEGFNIESVSFNDISRFVNDNQFFPNFSELRKNAEKIAIANNIPYNFSKKYFKNFPASNPESKLYLLKSEIDYANSYNLDSKEDAKKDIQDLTYNLWVNDDFSEEQEDKFLSTYNNKLTEEKHIARITRLIWDKKTKDAQRILYLIGEDQQKLFSSIIKISKNPNYINNIIYSIPRKLRNNELLAYNVIMWKKAQITKEDDAEEIVKMLLKIPKDVDNPDKWWGLRKLYSRELLKTKDYEKSYIIASNHGLKGSDEKFYDAEWTAGWIALRFLDRPKDAYDHFYNLYLNVGYPISVSRSSYWLGMASQAMGNKEEAIKWYKVASKYPIYFYGQLAIHKHRVLDPIGSQNDIILPKDPDILREDIEALARKDSLKTAYILAIIGDKKNATDIFEYAVERSKTSGEVSGIMKVVNEIKDRQLDVKISKAAAKKNVFFIKDKFQIIQKIEKDPSAPLIHAIIKQESGFAPSAYSSAGAIGFMQLMPDTAKLVSKKLGIEYSRRKLSGNMDYNVVLGSAYIKSLLDDFEGSEILAIAAYNAGPSNSRRWVREFYDPRETEDIDMVIDWIELITYSETRNYVQRIMENLIVYKYLMSRENYDEVK
ncbi:MAG: soluble lytic murein transglycosylase [Rickettsiales bacterium]